MCRYNQPRRTMARNADTRRHAYILFNDEIGEVREGHVLPRAEPAHGKAHRPALSSLGPLIAFFPLIESVPKSLRRPVGKLIPIKGVQQLMSATETHRSS